MQLLKSKPIPHLETAMCYIASQYVSTRSTATFSLELEALIASTDIPNDGFLVQTLLLFVIGLDGNNEQLRALEMLTRARKLAIQLGMHQHEFAILHGRGLPVLEESWRRTWWELYTVDGIIAGLHQISSFHLFDVVANVSLPCEEDLFRSGSIFISHTIDQFDELLFSDEEPEWSSYTYRILAIRNLGRILQHKNAAFLDNALLGSLDNHLVNWMLHLPNSKKDYFDSTGHVDELLFQAHMITNVSSILLHRQYSHFHDFASQHTTSCAPYPQGAPGWQARRMHGAKTIQSALDVTKLITLPTPLVKHTPFLTCAIALASIVHLACWSASTLISDDDDLKGQVRLGIGGLKAMAEIWPSAQRVLEQVTRVAQESFLRRKSTLNSLLWNDLEDGEIAGNFVSEGTINNAFQPL
ncbi:hypothetical protein LSUB1_G003589 [Lachnellula subtilissima]|uniref:Xylanolytic transcriptional activator regulatory domain-containing protein n=1 Tax=Lachnellula subtilissima TaxID=602034 RepID=A0A8H8RWY2_9HELO|nr:hypothetical protein LSUB1_G003589 [Lachnellula subtilissima]